MTALAALAAKTKTQRYMPEYVQGFFGRVVRRSLMSMMVVMSAMPVLATAANSIQSVSGSVQDGSEVISIEMSEPLASIPASFVIQTPARIALDLPGVTNSLSSSAIDLNLGNLRSVSVLQADERARVVLNLTLPTTYKAKLQGKTLLITLDNQTAAASLKAPPSFSESRNREVLALKDVEFRTGSDNAGRVVVSLLSNDVGVDVRQQGKTVVVEFKKTSLPEGLRRRLDVTDFGTLVQTVTTSQVGDKVRMVIEPTGQWEQSAYQSDNQFVLEIRPKKTDAVKQAQSSKFNGEKLSLNFQNIEIRSLLQVIADFTNLNVITSDTVVGSITLRLKDVPWDQALDIILQAKNLGSRKTDNVLLIAPKEELAVKDKLELESRAALQGLEPVRTQSFQINYAKASEIASQISSVGAGAVATSASGPAKESARILSNRGSVIAEPRTNQLFVTDIPSRIEQVQGFITKLDIPVRQVLIEARIVEASDTFGRSLGVRLGGGSTALPGGPVVAGPRISLGTNYSAAAGTTASNFVNLPASGLGVTSTIPAFALSIFNSAASRFLSLELSALEADGKGKIVSSPRVVTADQIKALIEQGTEYPYQVATSSGATSLAFRKANLKLEVTPQITPDGNILLDLEINKDSRGETTSAGIAIDTKHIRTQVLVENGGTVVIGGIFTMEETRNENKVPLLGDLPYVGNLFKNTQRNYRKQEMLVFITPKMIPGKILTP